MGPLNHWAAQAVAARITQHYEAADPEAVLLHPSPGQPRCSPPGSGLLIRTSRRPPAARKAQRVAHREAAGVPKAEVLALIEAHTEVARARYPPGELRVNVLHPQPRAPPERHDREHDVDDRPVPEGALLEVARIEEGTERDAASWASSLRRRCRGRLSLRDARAARRGRAATSTGWSSA